MTVSVHSNNIGTSVDVAAGCMQGSIVKHHDLLHGSCFIYYIVKKMVTYSTIKVLHHPTFSKFVTAFLQGFDKILEKPCGIG